MVNRPSHYSSTAVQQYVRRYTGTREEFGCFSSLEDSQPGKATRENSSTAVKLVRGFYIEINVVRMLQKTK